jgi:tRNA dimethylallyltransferase
MRRIAVLLMGPTGAGKSELALDLVRHFPLEIVSVDSALVYRGMDIGTAKPAIHLRSRVPHHLIDIRDAASGYSAGDFVRDAARAMQDIWSRGLHPLLVGGTMLYFHALTAGLAQLPEANAEVRKAIDEQAAAHGWASLHAELERVDPEAAARIHLHDPQRIQRALEVFRLTGSTITRLQQERHPVIGAGTELEATVVELALAPANRSWLHARIEARLQVMMAAGFLDEVRGFYDRGDLTGEHPSMRAVGYRQLWEHLAGADSLERATDKALVATRQLAKRQLTWLRQRASVQWFDMAHPQCAHSVQQALSGGAFAANAS